MARETRDPLHDGSPTSRLASATKAVSPVIGVVLMVLVVVALSAIIGTFVLNFGTSVEANVQASPSVTCDPGSPGAVQVVWTDNHNADRLLVKVSGDAYASEYAKALTDVGGTASFTEDAGTVSNDQTASVSVTGESGDSRTVLLFKDCEV